LGLDIDKKHPIYLEKFIKKYVLLRTKQEVGIQMPPLSIKDIIVDWEKEKEKELGYKLHKPLKKILVIQNDHLDIEENEDEEEKQGKQIQQQHNQNEITTNPLVDLLRARQVCILPKLLKQTFYSFCRSINDNNKNKTSPQTPRQTQGYTSKIDALIQKVLENKDNNNGKIIFCHFQQEIDTIMHKLQKGGIHNIKKYDGRDNKQTLHNIADKCDVLILQIQTCCEGLNLQEHFNECYFVSPHWNPSVEQQAIARCHRFGQKKGVKVFNFIMNDFKDKITIEKYIKTVQHKKLQLMNDFTKICKNKKKIIKKLIIQN
jgi:SNF2 family DNA or RNA helicase